MPVISASLFARFASRQQTSPTMQAVAALRGQFGGHQVMTVEEGEALRRGEEPVTLHEVRETREVAEGSTSPEAAASQGREAAEAGPSSGTGSTGGGSSSTGAAPDAGPTSGTGETS
jgi:6-phosphogluconate dehydrogenase